jgi:uncharacterized protein YfbU (UPF0304 family)
MATITLRVDDRTRDEVEASARGRGITLSELLRAAIDDVLGRDVDLPRRDVPNSLTMVERRMLMLQHQILAKLAGAELDDDAEYHARQIDVLAGGYTGEYPDEFTEIEPELSPRECELVWDILDMFRILKASIGHVGTEKVEQLDEHALRALTFRGFDANDSFESRLLRYARHLTSTGRWEELAELFDRAHENGNSHFPALATYRRMLDAFQPIWKGKLGRGFDPDDLLLTADELAQVLKAWPYSSNRSATASGGDG